MLEPGGSGGVEMGLDGGLFTGAIEFLGEMGLDGGFFTGVWKLIGRWAFTAAFFKVSVN